MVKKDTRTFEQIVADNEIREMVEEGLETERILNELCLRFGTKIWVLCPPDTQSGNGDKHEIHIRRTPIGKFLVENVYSDDDDELAPDPERGFATLEKVAGISNFIAGKLAEPPYERPTKNKHKKTDA